MDISGLNGDPPHTVFQLDKVSISFENIDLITDFHEIKKQIPFRIFIARGVSYIHNRLPYKARRIMTKLTSPIFNRFGMYLSAEGFVEPHFNSNPTKKIVLYGYYMSASYFQEINHFIVNEIAPPPGYKYIDEKLKRMINDVNSVCVHVRRGDFVALGYAVCTPDYYHRAFMHMSEQHSEAQFFIFSDEPEWVKKHIELPFNSIFVDTGSTISDFFLMSACKHFIISNSTFSWWAQFLSKSEDKIVIAPRRQTKIRDCDPFLNNLCMERWHLLNV